MPNMTGINLASELISIRPDIPVILCTGFSKMTTRDKAIAVGVSELVTKPIGAMNLAKIIRKVLCNE